jgi:hypothetical protein
MLREQLLDSPSLELENAVSDIIDKCNEVVRLEKVPVGLGRTCESAFR